MGLPKHTPESFWANVDKKSPEECWLWKKGLDSRKRYGHLTYQTKFWEAHRLAWTLTFGDIPTDMHVLHRCDVPQCCNPAHLFLGTHADNMADMKAKGRQRPTTWDGPRNFAKGSAHHNAKLTEQQVLDMRRLFAEGTSMRALARQFQVDRSVVKVIVTRQGWTHI